MPIVLTDFKNNTWCTEQMTDGFLHCGYTGQAGPRIQDLLDFSQSRAKQFENFVAKRQVGEVKDAARTSTSPRRHVRTRDTRSSGGDGVE